MKNPQKVEYNGEAQLYKPNVRPDEGDMGGGMTAAENRRSMMTARVESDRGMPKDCSHGSDLSRSATNVLKSYDTAATEEEVSPAATKQSGNKDQMQSY